MRIKWYGSSDSFKGSSLNPCALRSLCERYAWLWVEIVTLICKFALRNWKNGKHYSFQQNKNAEDAVCLERLFQGLEAFFFFFGLDFLIYIFLM